MIPQMDYSNRNLYHKRIFGNDITNITRRSSNYSISEKPSQKQAIDQRVKSRSVSTKPLSENKDPITQYEKQITNYMSSMQKLEQDQLYKHIHQDMRHVLVDWMIQVHQSFELKEQTLYLALTYLNKYCSKVEVTKHEYQLVGITCLWIASKYEEIYPPKMTNYVDVTDNSYTVKELKDMEGRIIVSMDFNLTYTTSLNMLEAISDKWPKERNHKNQKVMTKESLKNLNMCKYLLELTAISSLNKIYDTNTIVLGSITIADSIFKVKSEVKLLDETQKPDKQTLMKCFKSMCDVLKECHKHKKYNAVIKKFQKDKYSKVAKIKIAQK